MRWGNLLKLNPTIRDQFRGKNNPDSYAKAAKKNAQCVIDDKKDKQAAELWVKHQVDFPMDELQRREYEIFCGGFLYYHDEHVKSGKTNHTIYFEWGGTDNTTIVRVSLNPPAKKVDFDSETLLPETTERASDPPPPPQPPPPPVD